MAKYLNILLSSGIVTPLLISDVMKISTLAGAGAGAAVTSVTTITYASTATTTILTSQPIGAAGATNRSIPTTAAQRAAVDRALLQMVIEGVQTPWNQPILPLRGQSWDLTVEPVASQLVGAAFAAKQSTALLGTDSAGVIGALSAFATIA